MFMIGKDYWKTYERGIKKMIELKLIKASDAELFKVTDDINEVVVAANKIGHPKVSENYYDGFREATALAQRMKEKGERKDSGEDVDVEARKDS